VLETGDASELAALSPANRKHALSALASLSKYQGRYDEWLRLRQRYNLKWTSGNESLQSMQRLFNPDFSLDVMLQRIKEMIRLLHSSFMGKIIQFAVLVGLRPAEVLESVKLINDKQAFPIYYDSEQMTLQHYKFPQQFLRTTKKAYISFMTPEMLDIVKLPLRLRDTIPSYNAIRLACRKRGINMDMRFCRKIFATYLHNQQSGIPVEIIDALQGRTPATIFVKHYYRPSLDYREKVLTALERLKQEIEQ
jgi:intergrase/recombinase